MHKFLQQETFLGEADCSEDAKTSTQVKAVELDRKQALLDQATDPEEQLKLKLEMAYLMLDLEQRSEAWDLVHPLLEPCINQQQWQYAAEICDILFQADQADSIKALAHGIWLGVTYPIAADLSIALLQHFVDESPDRSDGAAVAAATACYIADIRTEGEERDSLTFFTNQLLGRVARSHSQVEEQDIFNFWVQQLELDEPTKFLPRLSTALDVITEHQWWFDRDALRANIKD